MAIVTEGLEYREGYLTLQQFTDGWPGSHFEHRTVTVRMRAVDRDDRNGPEVQVEITIDEVKGTKLLCYSYTASLILSPEEAEQVVAVMQKVARHADL